MYTFPNTATTALIDNNKWMTGLPHSQQSVKSHRLYMRCLHQGEWQKLYLVPLGWDEKRLQLWCFAFLIFMVSLLYNACIPMTTISSHYFHFLFISLLILFILLVRNNWLLLLFCIFIYFLIIFCYFIFRYNIELSNVLLD